MKATIIQMNYDQVIITGRTPKSLFNKLVKWGVVITEPEYTFLPLKAGYTQFPKKPMGAIRLKIES